MEHGLKIANPQDGVLIVGGKRFIDNYDDRDSAQKVINKYLKQKIKRNFVLESFGVNIDSIDPCLREVVQWRKGSGVSLWILVC